MTLTVDFTPMALSQLDILPTVDFAQLDQALNIASGDYPPPPLPGNQHALSRKHQGLCVLNQTHEIYFLRPASPAPCALVAFEIGSSLMWVAILKARRTPFPRSDQEKASLTSEAASALGIAVANIYPI